MQLRQLTIARFRGVRELTWRPDGAIACLIGPGDSTKTTIVEAIELTLSPRWDYEFDDSDFHGGNTEEPIEIHATVGQLPDTLLAEQKFGLEIRGWNAAAGPRDEPEEGDEPVLTIRLRVDSSLEPQWAVVNDRNPVGKIISSRDRQLLGVLRLGSFVDRQLTWNQGTVLWRITGPLADLPRILADAGRAARNAISAAAIPALAGAATRAQELGRELGVVARESFRPGLDLRKVNISQGGMSIHDGNVPVRRSGLGTRRLLTLALQRDIARSGCIALVDEVEHGLEPHRIRALVRQLAPDGQGQVILTTHSPVAIVELRANNLRVVRSRDGATQVLPVDDSLQGVVRAAPEALLGRKLIVCEGKTEMGICRALDRWWSSADLEQFGYLGVVPVDGGGNTQAPQRAMQLRTLGYTVLYLGDSDAPMSPDAATLRAAGIQVILWANNMAIEERIAADLPWDGMKDVVTYAAGLYGRQSVDSAIASRLGAAVPGGDIAGWQETPQLRAAIGLAAKSANGNGWFKKIELAEGLGDVVCRRIPDVPGTDLATKVAELRQWIDQE